MKKKQPEPDELKPEHAEWLVENRAKTQRVSAKLYRLLKEHSDELDKFAWGAQMLVAISFSLWRSAFLSDKTGFRVDTTEDAVGFLSEMLQNNAIAYQQERRTKDWTFNYYAGNARIRLQNLQTKWRNAALGPLMPPKGKQTPKYQWEVLQTAFEKAVNHFEKRLNG